jgi:hypothetical protein
MEIDSFNRPLGAGRVVVLTLDRADLDALRDGRPLLVQPIPTSGAFPTSVVLAPPRAA